MATITKPIALNETFKTSENPSRNIADVLAEELKGIADAVTNAENIENILTDMATTKDAQVISGTAVFDTVDGNLVKALNVEIVASQTGSGTPSPSNIRPISGHTEEVISVKDSTDTTQETYTTPFNQTVYGGTLDVLTGELTIDTATVTFNGSEGWAMQTGSNYYQFQLTVYQASNTLSAICDTFESISISDRGTKTGYIKYNDNLFRFALLSSEGITTVADWKTWLSTHNVTVTYTLATPTTLSLTPQTVKSLVGENHISASTGDVLECKYSMLINGDDLAQIIGG